MPILSAKSRSSPTYIDPAFAGALKVTPDHDPNDYEIGKRHHLPLINIMNAGTPTLNDEAGPCAGLDRYAARHEKCGKTWKRPV